MMRRQYSSSPRDVVNEARLLGHTLPFVEPKLNLSANRSIGKTRKPRYLSYACRNGGMEAADVIMG